MQERRDYIERIMFCFMSLRKGIVQQDSTDICRLPLGQTEAFMVINHEGSISVGSLAQRLSITSGAVTQLIDPLVKLGYVERIVDNKDRRITNLALTSEGKAFRAAMIASKQQKAKQVLEVLSDEELKTMTKLMEKVTGAIESNKEEKKG